MLASPDSCLLTSLKLDGVPDSTFQNSEFRSCRSSGAKGRHHCAGHCTRSEMETNALSVLKLSVKTFSEEIGVAVLIIPNHGNAIWGKFLLKSFTRASPWVAPDNLR